MAAGLSPTLHFALLTLHYTRLALWAVVTPCLPRYPGASILGVPSFGLGQRREVLPPPRCGALPSPGGTSPGGNGGGMRFDLSAGVSPCHSASILVFVLFLFV